MKNLSDAVLNFSNRQGYAAIPQADEENMPDSEVLAESTSGSNVLKNTTVRTYTLLFSVTTLFLVYLLAFSHTPSPPLPYTASSPATQQNEVDGVAVGEAVLGRSSMFRECHSKCDEKEACGFWTNKHGERLCCRWFYPSQGGQTCSLSVSKNAKGEEECRCMNEIIRTYGGDEPKEKSPSMQPHPASSKTDESAAGDYYKHLYAGQYLPPTPSTPTTPATTATTSTSTSTTPSSDNNNQVPSLSPTVVPRPPWMNYLPTSPGDAPSSSAASSWLNYMPSPPSPNDTPAPWGIHLPPYLQPTVKPSDGSSATSASTSTASTGAVTPGDPVAAAASAQAAAAAAQAAAASASVLPSTVTQPAAASVDTSAVNKPSTVNNEANPANNANNANNADKAPQRGVSMDINLNVDIIKEVTRDVVQRGVDTVNSAKIEENKESKGIKEINRKPSGGVDDDQDGGSAARK